MTVLAAALSLVTSRPKLSLTSNGNVLSKQLKQKVARKYHDEQADLGLSQRMPPLVEMRTLGDGLGRGRLAAFAQDEEGKEKVRTASAAATQPGRYGRNVPG